MALPQSQATLHCANKAGLYALGMSLGTRIKQARERLVPKCTQKEIADHFGVTDQAVSNWEGDRDVPELGKIVKLARALKVPVLWLLEEGGGPPPSPNALETKIERLLPPDRDVVEATIEALMNRQRKEGAA